MSELDELDEIKIGPDCSASAKKTRNGKRLATVNFLRWAAQPKWVRQLRSSKGRAEVQKLKAKVTA